MAEPISLRFESTLPASREQVWEWITSVKGISAEMWPVLRMTVPRGIRSLADVPLTAGAPLFRSYVFLFGVLPFDYSDLTLLEITAGDGFVEQSPMGSMKLWRHERRIVPSPTDRSAVVLVDQLRFEPRFASSLVRWFIRRFFEHRHRVVRAHFGADAGPPSRPLAGRGRRRRRGRAWSRAGRPPRTRRRWSARRWSRRAPPGRRSARA